MCECMRACVQDPQSSADAALSSLLRAPTLKGRQYCLRASVCADAAAAAAVCVRVQQTHNTMPVHACRRAKQPAAKHVCIHHIIACLHAQHLTRAHAAVSRVSFSLFVAAAATVVVVDVVV